jgi:protein-S-isoprenylcysteine O-methyltransferase Ste14
VIALAYPTLACCALLEVGLRVREAVQGKGGRDRDRGTRVLIAISLGNWLSVFACLVLPLPALAWRIRVEEAELSRVLGHAYRAYQTRTARLIPGLW